MEGLMVCSALAFVLAAAVNGNPPSCIDICKAILNNRYPPWVSHCKCTLTEKFNYFKVQPRNSYNTNKKHYNPIALRSKSLLKNKKSGPNNEDLDIMQLVPNPFSFINSEENLIANAVREINIETDAIPLYLDTDAGNSARHASSDNKDTSEGYSNKNNIISQTTLPNCQELYADLFKKKNTINYTKSFQREINDLVDKIKRTCKDDNVFIDKVSTEFLNNLLHDVNGPQNINQEIKDDARNMYPYIGENLEVNTSKPASYQGGEKYITEIKNKDSTETGRLENSKIYRIFNYYNPVEDLTRPSKPLLANVLNHGQNTSNNVVVDNILAVVNTEQPIPISNIKNDIESTINVDTINMVNPLNDITSINKNHYKVETNTSLSGININGKLSLKIENNTSELLTTHLNGTRVNESYNNTQLNVSKEREESITKSSYEDDITSSNIKKYRDQSDNFIAQIPVVDTTTSNYNIPQEVSEINHIDEKENSITTSPILLVTETYDDNITMNTEKNTNLKNYQANMTTGLIEDVITKTLPLETVTPDILTDTVDDDAIMRTIKNNVEQSNELDNDIVPILEANLDNSKVHIEDPKESEEEYKFIGLQTNKTVDNNTKFVTLNNSQVNNSDSLRSQYQEGEYNITKVVTIEYPNDTVVTYTDGIEEIPNMDFINSTDSQAKGNISKETKNITLIHSNCDHKKNNTSVDISGKLYLKFNKDYIPAAIEQTQNNTKMHITLDGFSICEDYNKNTNNKSIFLSHLCNIAQKYAKEDK